MTRYIGRGGQTGTDSGQVERTCQQELMLDKECDIKAALKADLINNYKPFVIYFVVLIS